jgi:hypothetical protein
MIKKQGRGTGTLRQNYFDEQTKDWVVCTHICEICKIPSNHVLTRKKDKRYWESFQFIGYKQWTHKIVPGFICHIGQLLYPCDKCNPLFFPEWYKDFHYK